MPPASHGSNQIEEHQQQDYAINTIKDCEQLCKWGGRWKISVPNRRQRNHHKVERIQPAPAFQSMVDGGTHYDID